MLDRIDDTMSEKARELAIAARDGNSGAIGETVGMLEALGSIRRYVAEAQERIGVTIPLSSEKNALEVKYGKDKLTEDLQKKHTEWAEKTVGEIAIRLRNLRGYTQEDVANGMSLTPGAISLYENGRRRIPLDRVGSFLSAGLGLSQEQLDDPLVRYFVIRVQWDYVDHENEMHRRRFHE